MADQDRPRAFYGVNVEGPGRPVRMGDDRPSGSRRQMESLMNVPNARSVPVEGAVTGPEAPAPEVDEITASIDLDDLPR